MYGFKVKVGNVGVDQTHPVQHLSGTLFTSSVWDAGRVFLGAPSSPPRALRGPHSVNVGPPTEGIVHEPVSKSPHGWMPWSPAPCPVIFFAGSRSLRHVGKVQPRHIGMSRLSQEVSRALIGRGAGPQCFPKAFQFTSLYHCNPPWYILKGT